jgi:stage IV sporulation protein FB
MKFRLFDTEIYISFLFSAAVTIMLLTDKTGYMLPALFAIILHEMGHLFMMWILECSPKRIKLIPASVQITAPFQKRYRNDFLVSVSGPAVNILLFLTLYFNYLAFGNEVTLYFALLNLVIGVFNLLPVKGLDGGTILFCILEKYKGPDKAAVTLKIITIILAAALILTAITLTLRGKINISVYIMGIYLFIMSLLKN